MKKIRYCLALLVASALVGCGTFQQVKDMPPEQKAAEVQSLATDAASIGTTVTLQVYPQYKPAFDAAYIELDRQVNGTAVIDIESIRQVLATLPIKELKGNEAALAVQGTRIVFRRITTGQTEENIHLYTRALATGIRDGLKEALGK